jgi:DNA polymerase
MSTARPPEDATTLDALRRAAASCTGCDLYKRATQTVFGEGNPHESLMLLGEQPGHEEDLAGRPFVGPARGICGIWGQVLHYDMIIR